VRLALEFLWCAVAVAVAVLLLWPVSPLATWGVVLSLLLWTWFDPLGSRKPAIGKRVGVAAGDPAPFAPVTPKSSAAQPKPRADDALSEGSGFFVDKSGHLITNYHVIEQGEDGASLWVEHGRRRYPLTVEAVDPDLDLALCSSGIKRSIPAAFREDGLVRLGERCIAAGFPRQQAFTITDGMVSKLTGENNRAGLIQISAPVHPGSSGGPLIDRFGNIIGIVVATLDKLDEFERTQHIAENINFAVRLDALQDFLTQAGVDYFVAPNDSEADSEEIAAESARYTARISVTA